MANSKEPNCSTPLLNWFEKQKNSRITKSIDKKQDLTAKLWNKCQICDVYTYIKELQVNLMVCTQCGHHNLVDSNDRIQQLIDDRTWIPINEALYPNDPLKFHDCKAYSDRLKSYQAKTGLTEAVQTGLGSIDGLPVALGVMDFKFMGGSMGSVVGEKLTCLIERATYDRLPVIIVCASGGARMQEGMLSLMQMAKISGALERHREAGLLYISVLTHPTMGGVTASFAMLGDIILAEPQASIGFAGKRVIQQTIKESLPKKFQTAEELLEHGFVDSIVSRTKLKSTLARLIAFHTYSHEPMALNIENLPQVDLKLKPQLQKPALTQTYG